MPNVRRLPTADVVSNLVDEGKSDREIALLYGVVPEAVRTFRHRHGIERESKRAAHGEYLPWRVRADHGGDVLVKRLRDYSREQQGYELTPRSRRLLDDFKRYMDGENPYEVPLVVNYDRDDPEGFWLEPAQDGDEHYVRRPA